MRTDRGYVGEHGRGTVVVPAPASQAWFWTKDRQAREREVDEHVTAGRVSDWADTDALLGHLDGLDAPSAPHEGFKAP